MGNKCSKKQIQKQIAADEKKQVELKQQQQQLKVINAPPTTSQIKKY